MNRARRARDAGGSGWSILVAATTLAFAASPIIGLGAEPVVPPVVRIITGTIQVGTGGATGKAVHQPINFKKTTDLGSPSLYGDAAKNAAGQPRSPAPKVSAAGGDVVVESAELVSMVGAPCSSIVITASLRDGTTNAVHATGDSASGRCTYTVPLDAPAKPGGIRPSLLKLTLATDDGKHRIDVDGGALGGLKNGIVNFSAGSGIASRPQPSEVYDAGATQTLPVVPGVARTKWLYPPTSVRAAWIANDNISVVWTPDPRSDAQYYYVEHSSAIVHSPADRESWTRVPLPGSVGNNITSWHGGPFVPPTSAGANYSFRVCAVEVLSSPGLVTPAQNTLCSPPVAVMQDDHALPTTRVTPSPTSTLRQSAVITPAARAMESLSPSDRVSLSDATLVKLITGRTVSLGVLRAEHKLRLQRFANAATLGKRQVTDVPATRDALVPSKSTGIKKTGTVSLAPTLVPMSYSLNAFLPSAFFDASMPADFAAFCHAAAATACLYLPGGVQLLNNPCCTDALMDVDPLITDVGLCSSEGGVEGSGSAGSGCWYSYPTTYNLNFSPGQPTAQGYQVTQSANCASPFSYTVDPHGAVKLGYTGGLAFNGLPSAQSCIVSVYVNK